MFPVFSQVTKVRGRVIDAETKETIPAASVFFTKTTIGTITDDNGNFFLEAKTTADSITVVCLGYIKTTKPIKRNFYQEVNFALETNSVELQTVIVTPGENPANILLRKVIANKKKNNPENLEYYHCEKYTKTQIDLNNIDEEFKNKAIFNQFQFIFENLDTNAVTGKVYLPVLITENLSDYYFQSRGETEREIVKATKLSGVQNESVSRFVAKLSKTFNPYDNFMTFYQESGFVSPISDLGIAYYKYKLLDTMIMDGHSCLHVTFTPRRKQERTFNGDFWIVDTSYALKKIQMRLVDDANLNFINSLVASYEYKPVQDTLWLLTAEKFMVDFNVTESDRMRGFFGTKSTFYNNYDFDGPLDKEIKALRTDVAVSDSAIKRDKDYWDKNRPVQLSSRDQKVYNMVDSIQQVPLYQTIANIVNLVVNYHYVIGPIELGPYFSTYSFNRVEGNRFRLGFQTSNDFSKKVLYDGYIAYGTLDQRFKYKAGMLYMFNKNPRRAFSVSYMHDVKQLGMSPYTFRSDNILTSLLRRRPFYKLQMVDKFNTYYEHEWFQGFSNTVSFTHRRVYPTKYIPFLYETTIDTFAQPSVISSEITLATHFAYEETYMMGEFERVSLGTEYPIVDLYLTMGIKNLFGSQYNYQKINLTVTHFFNTNPIGYFKYTIDAGKYFGKLPYPLLELHKGNESYAYDYFAYSMMNYYEFVSDQYVSLIAEQHLQGMFLNYIPLMRKLKWREVVSFKGIVGSLKDSNRDVMLFPEGLNALSKPYMEAGIGIENIFKVFRIDAVWRLTYLGNPDVSGFGIRGKLQLIL